MKSSLNTVKESNGDVLYTNSIDNMKRYYFNKGFRMGISIGVIVCLLVYFMTL